MINAQNINLYFGSLHLLQNVSFTISANEKIALIGKNGAGKTSLFKLLTGDLKPDSGQIAVPGDYTIGYLSQHFDFDEQKTIKEICLEVFAEYFRIEDRIAEISNALGEMEVGDEMNKALDELEKLSIVQSASVQSNPHAEIARVLKGLGFNEEQFDDAVMTLSGGWKMRVQIARLLLMKPDLLLLDEPDNHLDLEALIWFEKYIRSYPGSVLFISHDVEFMSNTADRIMELANRKISDYKMGFRRYLNEKSIRQEKDEQAFVNQQKMIKQKEKTINRFMAKATKTKMAQSMQKQLDKVERIEIESEDTTQINIRFPETRQSGKLVLKLDKVSKAFGDHLVIDKQSMQIDRGSKIAFVGQNGQGKSTLIKLIAGILTPDKGNIELGHNVIVSYFAQNQSEVFDEKKTVLEALEHRADPEFVPMARKTLGSFAFSGDDAGKKVSVLSGGEKARLAMACMVSRQSNFLLLDEPTNHLDIYSKEILKSAIKNYPGTLIIVSHDREILRGVIDITYEFREGHIYEHLGDLDYVLSKRDADSLRSFQTDNSKSKSAEKEKNTSLGYEEMKQLNRQISNAEKNIDKIEKKITSLQTKLIDPDYYASADGQSAIKELSELEKNLESENETWDKLVSQLEE